MNTNSRLQKSAARRALEAAAAVLRTTLPEQHDAPQQDASGSDSKTPPNDNDTAASSNPNSVELKGNKPTGEDKAEKGNGEGSGGASKEVKPGFVFGWLWVAFDNTV